LDDCFEGIICFETLNPSHKNAISDDEDDIEFVGSTQPGTNFANATCGAKIFDIINHFATHNDATTLPKTPIVCKPSESAIEKALKVANLNAQRTVNSINWLALFIHPQL